MPETSERTALYRYFDSTGALLYIGISNDPNFRAKAHLYESRPDAWPKQAVRRVDEWHTSRAAALAAEEKAIRFERPRYNQKHNYDDAPFASCSSVILQDEGLLDLKAGHGLFVRPESKAPPALPHNWPQAHNFPG